MPFIRSQHASLALLPADLREYRQVRVDDWVWFHRALIEGHSDADGHEQEGGIVAATSVSRCLAVGIRLLLHSLGVAASISKTAASEQPRVGDPDRTMNCRDAYHISWRRENQWEKGHRSDLHIWGRVRDVSPARQATDVVDITVADDHSFIADGQVVHNCDWGPLFPTNHPDPKKRDRPDPARKGRSFAGWKSHLTWLGYRVEWRELRACDYGAPTIRKRLFVVARCDGQPIVWPDPTHGDPKKIGRSWFDRDLKPWRTAAECIDWSIPCPSIFERERPLAPNTLRRIAAGIRRYVLESPRPFVVNLTHAGGERVEDLDEPLRTVTGANRGEKALCAPFLARIG